MTDLESQLSRLELQYHQLERGVRCARRILSLAENPEYGISRTEKLEAVADVLTVASERADGRSTCVSERTMRLMRVLLADIELSALWDRVGLSNWSPK